MTGKCKIEDCVAPISCHEGHEDYRKCEHWIANNSEKTEERAKVSTDSKKSNLSWRGEPLKIDELHLVSSRSSPIVIGVVGKAAAGKTTFLAMVYTLLLGGKRFKEYGFAGTKTILNWDELHYRLEVQKEKVAFPDPTPAGINRLLHFALRNKEGHLQDVLFSDTSGEVFSLWSQNRYDENAEIARWIYSNSNGFILFMDCADLIERKNLAKTEILDIAHMLKHDLKKRPVVAVWSKSDKKNKVHPKIKKSLHAEIQILFSNYKEIDISNFLIPGPDKVVHVNNLKVIDWLMSRIMTSLAEDLILTEPNSNDLFLNYKGR